MIILDATTKSLKVVLAGAVATTQLPITAHYTDITTTAYTPGSNDTVTNNTTAVEFVAAPAASTQRHVESISVYNVDTASATVTIQYVSAGGTRQIIKVVLLTLEALYYEDGTGWQTIDANGNIKHTFSGMVSDTAYTASWDTVTGVAPSKNAVYDQLEAHKAVQTSVHGLAITAGKTITVTDNTTLAGPASVTVAGPIEIATNAESLTGTDTARAVTPDDLKYVLDSRLPLFYGVSWDESADTYVRTGATAGQANAVTLADAFLPIQRRMRGCLLSNAGTVNYYLSATDWTKKEDGATASVLTGADGQVMIEIPKFWYRYGYAGTTHTWEVSPVPLAGFQVHPAFLSGATELSFAYVGAYEAVLYDTSGSIYANKFSPVASHSATFDVDNGSSKGTITAGAGTPYTLLLAGYTIVITGTADNNGTYVVDSVTGGNVITCTTVIAGADGVEATTVISAITADFTATTGDVLSSVSGKLPWTLGTRANFRAIAANRGTGWSQWFGDVEGAIQLLFLTEYASFYSQSVIGAGISNVTDWAAYNNYYPIAPTGNSNAIGNATGNTAGAAACATEATKYMKYRGLENWYGHLWKFADGFNVNNNIPYLCNVIANFADDTASNYTNPTDVLGVAVTMHNADGYQATLKKSGRGFMPASVGADGATKITDYYYQAAGWRVVVVGGNAYIGAYVGAFFVHATYVSGTAYSTFSSRVCFRK